MKETAVGRDAQRHLHQPQHLALPGLLVDDEQSADASADVQVPAADGEGLQAQKKEIIEVSLVRKGARENCLVTAYEDGLGTRFTRVQAGAGAGAEAAADPWGSFDLGA